MMRKKGMLKKYQMNSRGLSRNPRLWKLLAADPTRYTKPEYNRQTTRRTAMDVVIRPWYASQMT